MPERLARFAVSEWPGLGCEAAIDAWAAEREAWAIQHAWTEPFVAFNGARRELLMTPLGTSLDRMKAKREAWLLACCEPADPPETANGHRGR